MECNSTGIYIVTLKTKLSGLYLVLDPGIPADELMAKTEQALAGGVDLLQIWGKWADKEQATSLGRRIIELSRKRGVPVIVNNDIDLAKEIGADGVHLDSFDIQPRDAKARLKENSIVGITCGNDLKRVRWAELTGADYISFCSIYPSSSVDQCEIVSLETVRQAKKIVKIPVFASGGLNKDNVNEVLKAGVDGIAVISAILRDPDPREASMFFKKLMDKSTPNLTTR